MASELILATEDGFAPAPPLIIVLGGGPPVSLQPLSPPPYVIERCLIALGHYQRLSLTYKQVLILCLSSGTAHVPVALTNAGLPLHESVVSAAYLSTVLKVPSSHILVETTSYDTVGNAFYARLHHLDIGGHRHHNSGGREIIIITSEFHMPRSTIIFDSVLSLPRNRCLCEEGEGGGKAKCHCIPSGSKGCKWKVSYVESANTGLEDSEVVARREREAASAAAIKRKLDGCRDMNDLYLFMNYEHSMYSAKGLIAAAETPRDAAPIALSEELLKSYGAALSEELLKSYGSSLKP